MQQKFFSTSPTTRLVLGAPSKFKGDKGAFSFGMYDKLNVSLYKKNLGAKVSYSEVKPFDSVSENFSYISTIIRELQDSERVED